MLASADSLKSQILALTPTKEAVSGITAFVGIIADFTNNVQAGSMGTVGIFTFNNAVMIAAMLAMEPVSDASWIPTFVSGWQSAVTASVIAPSTVTNSAWSGSGDKDTETSPSAATTITTIAAAAATLTSGLTGISPTSDSTLQFATAIRNATLAFTFTCIGLGVPPALPPIPITIAAE